MKISDIDAKGYDEAVSNPDSPFNQSLLDIEANQAEWTEVEGNAVLRVAGSSLVAVPQSGRKNAKNFTVVDLNDRSEAVCFLKKNEVRGWLCRAHLASLVNS